MGDHMAGRMAQASSPFPVGSQLLLERALYDHHGVLVAPDRVAEYQDGVIREVAYVHFADGATPKLVAEPTLPVDVVVHRARFLTGERRYGFLLNNCEHFASWCCHGDAYCAQLLEPTTFIGQAARNLLWPFWAVFNAVQLLGGEPWDAPQYCPHCQNEHGWSSDGSVVPVPAGSTVLLAVKRELDAVRRRSLASTPEDARAIAAIVRQTLLPVLGFMDELDARPDHRRAKDFAEAIHRVERGIVELLYEPAPQDANGFREEHKRLNGDLALLLRELQQL